MKPTLEQALKAFGIADLDDFVSKVPGNRRYLGYVYRGERPVSKKVGYRILELTGGALTLEYLFSLGPNDRKRQR